MKGKLKVGDRESNLTYRGAKKGKFGQECQSSDGDDIR